MTVSYATYGIIDSNGCVPEGITGLQAGAVRHLPYEAIGAAVSVVTESVRDVVAGAVEHEVVVERLMQTHTVLPMRFPTIFAGQEAVLAMMSQHYDRFREDLHRLHNHVEFGVRVLWPRGQGRSPLRLRPSSGAMPGRDALATMSGKQYLQERYRRYQDRRALGEQAAQFGRGLDAALSEFATAKRLRTVAPDAFAFDGVYLVDKDKGAGFRLAFADVKRSEPGFEYLLSGPWPPYNFVTG